MTILERRMLTIALVLGILTAGIAAGKMLDGNAWQPPVAQAHSGSFYGTNESLVAAAAWQWPQKQDNWCGVANIEVIANYTYELIGGSSDRPFMSGGQQRIAADLNSDAAVSEWGTPSSNGTGPGFRADIARDGGTDPRAIAWGSEYESAAGIYWRIGDSHEGTVHSHIAAPHFTYAFSDIIYHLAVNHAIAGVARTLERFNMPISITMAHGLHSDIISGVYSTNDPISSYPNTNVDAVNAWDPAVGTPSGGYQSAREVTWDNYTFNTDANMWGTPYASNNGYDPDPAVGIYTPNSQYPTHWIGVRTAIEPNSNVTLNPDFALDENGNVMMHP